MQASIPRKQHVSNIATSDTNSITARCLVCRNWTVDRDLTEKLVFFSCALYQTDAQIQDACPTQSGTCARKWQLKPSRILCHTHNKTLQHLDQVRSCKSKRKCDEKDVFSANVRTNVRFPYWPYPPISIRTTGVSGV